MKKTIIIGAMLLGAGVVAQAAVHLAVGITIPVVTLPARVVYTPPAPPVYQVPAQVCSVPAPAVVYSPPVAVVYATPRAVCAPRVYVPAPRVACSLGPWWGPRRPIYRPPVHHPVGHTAKPGYGHR